MYPQQNEMPQQGGFGGPPQGGFGGPAMMPSASGYEFSEYENVVIKELSDNASFYGTVALVLGALGTVGAAITIASGANRSFSVVSVVGLLVQGFFARNAAQRFQLVVNTQGNDVPLLMDALSHLQRFYVATLVVSVVSLLATITAIFTSLSMPSL